MLIPIGDTKIMTTKIYTLTNYGLYYPKKTTINENENHKEKN